MTDRSVVIRRIYPNADAALDLPADQAQLDRLYSTGSTPWLRLNLVSSIDGSAIGPDGTSSTLTGGADRKVLGAIRRASDVVLVGADSFRAEGYMLPRTVPLAVVTSSGSLAGHGMPASIDLGRLLVICPPSVAARARSTLVVRGAEIVEIGNIGAGALDPATIIATLHSRGLTSIVCEGGPTLAGSLIAAGLVDELCLSISPILGGPSLPMLGGVRLDRERLSLAELLVDDSGFSFARWSLRRHSVER